jgi:hypothetical protein
MSSRSPQLCQAIYPGFLPQTHPLPAVVIELDSDIDEQLLDGGQSELRQALVTVLCYSESLITALALAASVKAALIGYTGAMGAHVAKLIRKEDETLTGLRGVSLQFFIAYQTT